MASTTAWCPRPKGTCPGPARARRPRSGERGAATQCRCLGSNPRRARRATVDRGGYLGFYRKVADEPLKLTLFIGNYTEQVTWLDAATGRLIAEPNFFEPMTLRSFITLGFGGRA